MKGWKLLMVMLSLFGTAAAVAERVPPGTAEEIRERLQPFGTLCRPGDPCAQSAATAGAEGGAMSGQQVYDQFCSACHGTGVAGAPKFGDAAAWGPRLDKGMDTLWQHTLNGFNAMPPRGTCIACSEEELRGALDYLVGQVQ
ncbi:MAG TPA: cytochrome c5 family protein [Pseudomonadales bacterium]